MKRLFFIAKFFGYQRVNNHLGFQVPDLDALISSSAQPVSVGGEDKRVDDFTSIKGVKALALVQVPSMAVPSLPPDAHREPSGETHTVLRYPVCPMRSLRSLQLVKAQTLTRRSQPHETISGTDWLGLKRTQETHSE